MRSISRWLLAAALALNIAGCKEDTKGGERRLVVLFTTDEHSQLFASAPEVDDFPGGHVPMTTAAGTGTLAGGVARRLAILERERAAANGRGADVLTLSSGDFSQGSLASAAWVATSPELRLMKRMGYDAVSLGNHEFDLGPAALAGAVAAAATAGELPPLVLSNLFPGATDPLAAIYGPEAGKLIAPYKVLETAHGLRIGIVASMGVEAGTVAGAAPANEFWSSTAATNEEKFASITAAVQKAVNTLREVEKVDAVILLAHGGIKAQQMKGEDELLAYQLGGVDLVLSGHSHLSTPQPRLVFKAGAVVPVAQPRPYGKEVGRVELVFLDEPEGTPRPYMDPAGSAFLAVDDRTTPTTDAAFLTELYTQTIGFLEVGAPGLPQSFLESTLSKVLGTTVTDDPAVLGDLYFHELGKTDFDVEGLAPGETNVLNLDADAMLAAANAFAPTVAALQASGPIRGDLRVGKTGAITFADVYHLVPLGGDPTAGQNPNAIPGYPLVRVLIHTVALRGAIEGTLQQSLLNGDFFVGVSGLKVKYDMTRTPFDSTNPVSPGWVKYLATVVGSTETVLYDVDNTDFALTGGFARNPGDLTWVQPMVTTYYVAGFASAFGIPLVDPTDGQLVSATNPLTDTILKRADQGNVKDYEALATYVKAVCDANLVNPGFLPSQYDETTTEGAVPRRMVNCAGGCP